MIKRIGSGLLWFLAGWCSWGFVAFVGDLSPLWGPVLGAALAAIVAGDPLHRIWVPLISVERVEGRLESANSPT